MTCSNPSLDFCSSCHASSWVEDSATSASASASAYASEAWNALVTDTFGICWEGMVVKLDRLSVWGHPLFYFGNMTGERVAVLGTLVSSRKTILKSSIHEVTLSPAESYRSLSPLRATHASVSFQAPVLE